MRGYSVCFLLRNKKKYPDIIINTPVIRTSAMRLRTNCTWSFAAPVALNTTRINGDVETTLQRWNGTSKHTKECCIDVVCQLNSNGSVIDRQRTSDSCNVSLRIKLVKIKFLIYQKKSLKICSSKFYIACYKFIFWYYSTKTKREFWWKKSNFKI